MPNHSYLSGEYISRITYGMIGDNIDGFILAESIFAKEDKTVALIYTKEFAPVMVAAKEGEPFYGIKIRAKETVNQMMEKRMEMERGRVRS